MRTKNIRKIFSRLLALIVVFSLTMMLPTMAFAESGKKKITSSKSMSAVVKLNETKNSSEVSFTVSGLPSDAVITKLEVEPGKLSFYGGVLTHYLSIRNNTGQIEKITWGGQQSETLRTNSFNGLSANGTYTISFNCTCTSDLVNGSFVGFGSKTYSNPTLIVYWDDNK